MPKGSKVIITVSSGPSTAAVPDVIGKAEADARSAIESAGFRPEVVYEVHTNTGTVFDQTPKAPQETKLGTTVIIKVDSAQIP